MPTPTARAGHDARFPGHVSTLAVTDPELIELFDTFAFDEIAPHGDLEPKTRVLTHLAAMVACQAVSAYRVMVGTALTLGATPAEVKEVVYQAVPYVGMAKVFDFLHATNEVLTERGIALPLDGQATTTPDTRMADGLAVQQHVVGKDAVDAMYANAPVDEQHIQRALSGNCFGDYLTRTGIDLPIRELLTFSMLVSLGGCDAQVAGHVRGNLNVGNTRATLLAVLTHLLPFIGYPRTLNGLRVLDEITLPQENA